MRWWRERVLGLCLAIAGTIALASPHAVAETGRRFVTIGTGGATSTYLAVGEAICDLLTAGTDRSDGAEGAGAVRCAAPATGGSIYNISQLAKGAFDFGLVQSDWQYHSYNGTAPGLVTRFEGLRAVISLYPEPVQVVVGKKARIARFKDLKGKRVSTGNLGSGTRATMAVLMEAHRLAADEFEAITELTSVEQAAALCDGKIDAFALAAGAPDARIARATNECGARILPMDTPIERELVGSRPYLDFFTLAKGTYATLSEDVTTVGVMATLVTRASEDEGKVYRLVRAIIENIASFRSKNPALRDLDPKEMATRGLWAPLHPGALRYYREEGWRED